MAVTQAEPVAEKAASLAILRGSGRVQKGLGTLEVEVRRDGHSAAGVEVQVFQFERVDGAPTGSWHDPTRAVTDQAGVARFQVPASRHLIVAKTSKPLVKQHDVAGGTTPDHVLLEAGPESRLTGTTSDAESKQPLGAVTLTWRPQLLAPAPDAAVIRVESDSLGRFALDVPKAIAGELEARAPGYSAAVALTDSTPEDGPYALALEPASIAEGVVVTQAGAPVAGASVRSQPSDGPAVTTSPRGTFMLQIPAGGVTLEALTSTGRRALLRINHAPARETVRGVKLVVDEGHDVQGKVIDASSQQPVAGASVHLFSEPDALEVATGVSDATGHFHFAAIPTGRYSLFAQLGFGARGRAVGLELPSATEVVVSLTPAATIAGRITDREGQSAVGVEVTLEFPKGLNEPAMRTRSDENGEFLFEGVLSSMVYLSATLGTLSTALDVYAAQDQVTRADLAFELTSHITGKVKNAKTKYIVGAWKGNSVKGAQAESAADGTFSLEVTPGTWHVAASPIDNHAGGMRFNERVEVTAGRDIEIELEPPTGFTDDAGDSETDFFTGIADGIAFDAENGSVKVGFLTSVSPAYKTGLRSGDLVVSINGAPISTTLDAFAKAKTPPAEYVIRRAGTEFRFRVAPE